ncbi:HAD-IB family phosphatase, partial [bacterium]|nr:HAD-IB family phosphatase [bacterium]
MINNIIFDFDSVILRAEAVELILQQALLRLDEKTRVLCTSKLNQITYLADIGETPIAEAMQERFALAPVYRRDVEAGADQLLAALSPKVRDTFAALRAAGKRLFIFSTGSDEWVRPVTRSLQVEDDHVFTNQLLYDDQGRVTGFDEKNPLFLSVGKGYIVEQLKNEGRLPGGTAVVGSGASDLAIRKNEIAQMFVYFSTQRMHEEIRRQADFSVDSLDQMLPLFFSEDELSHERIQAIYVKNGFGKAAGKPHVLLLESVHEIAVKKLQNEGWNLRQGIGAWRSEKLISDAGEVQVLGIRSQTRLNAQTLAGLPRLWAVGAFCIGTNQIDLQAAADAGIPVFNAPYSNTRSVAELVVGEIIMLLRRIPEKSRAAHAGQWLKSAAGCTEIRGKTVGIIGYGHIGSQVSVLLENLGMSVLFHDIVDKLPLGNARRASGLEELLKNADVVTLHVPDTSETRNLMSEARIRKMKKGAVLINSSRGKVVDLVALRAALDEGVLSGAALDV